MSYRQITTNNHSAMSTRQSNRSSINSSLINISKQLNNISINDVNILKLRSEKNKLYSKNKKGRKRETDYSSRHQSKRGKYRRMIFKTFPHLDKSHININFSFCRSETFSILSDKFINALNKNDLRKKNYILKENLKFLLNEIKKYKKSEIYDDNQIKEYEDKINYYINEIKKYKIEILILKEKYNELIKENKELQKYAQIESNKVNNFQGIHLISKADINNLLSKKPKNLKCFKKINLNLNNYINREKTSNKDNISNYTTSTSRNNKNIDLSVIKNFNSSKYIFVDSKSSFPNSKEKFKPFNHINNNSGFILNSKISKNNNNNSLSNNNGKNSKKRKETKNEKEINQIIFSRIENKKFKKQFENKTFKNTFNLTSLRNSSFDLNKTINLSQSFRYFKDNDIKTFDKKKLYLNKYKNFIYLNNNTFNS